MNKTHERSTPVSDADFPGARAREIRVPGRFATWLAFFLAIAVGMSAWTVVSTGVSEVSAAAADPQAMAHVPYFPSLYFNQATAVEPAPPTF